MFDVKKIRKDFPMLKQTMQHHPLAFFDNASTTFKPQCVIDAINLYYTKETSNSHRGDYDLCYHVDQEIDATRQLVAKFIHADPTEIVFTSGASMSINLVAFGYAAKYLKKNDEILLTEAEHASNVLPWYKVAQMTGAKVKFIPLNKEGRLTLENVKKVTNKKTKIIAIAQVTNVLGYLVPIKEITKFAHHHGIIVVCDGAQSVPHRYTDVKDLDVDFLSFSGHKMCGPTGIGVLYGKFALLDKTDPLMTGGGMNSRFDMCGAVEYLAPPMKFEAGTLNIAGIYGLKAAVTYLMKLGMKNIEKYESTLRQYLLTQLKKMPDIIIYNEHAESGIITINKTKVFAQDEATYLNSQGIAARSGQHCAKILNKFLNTPATIRLSLYFYNTKEECDRLIKALKKGDYLDAYFA
ncbi:MAG: aminotransferase class V-fold PLP-dependent enzyme [Bacilli bacterium]|nr:aminotransferase class V-fold PLP-dependent enzyme [Bacilli bacterium]